MSKPIISVENLSKAYRIGLKEEIPDTLMGALGQIARSPLKNLNRLSRLDTFTSSNHDDNHADTLWALREISFDVAEGEVLGIIGRNGAGKSTLLKVLSRITEPTSGRVILRGRVSSLLEVGTGFHPELSGRENVYMNGTILGMTKREIDRKFDEIVDFSGVEKFLDTPVKRYSSGMKVRLAFAVAAHLEPEILIIDEVLAVGDQEFQNKCMGKMQTVAKGGRTVLFVSHNMAAVTNLCSRGMVVHQGRKGFEGPVDEAISYYNDSYTGIGTAEDPDLDSYREKWCRPYITYARFVDTNGQYPPTIPLGGSIAVELGFSARSEPSLTTPVLGLVFNHTSKGTVAGVNTRMTGFQLERGSYSDGVLRCQIPRLPFLQGRYTIDLWLGDGRSDVDVLKQYLCFDISPTDYYGTGHPPFGHMGTTLLDAEWAFDEAGQLFA